MRRYLARRGNPGLLRAAQRLHRFPRGEMQQMQRPLFVCGKCEIALDHDALRDGWITGEAELRGDGPFVHLSVAGERRLLAVNGDVPAVLKRAAHQAR